MTESVGLPLAFGAGVLSFLSPCVLPLIPSYISFITGLTLEDAGARRWAALSHAAFFVLGFTFIFVALGASATALGSLLQYHRVWLERIGGALIVVFGLYLLGVFRWGALARERRIHLQDKPVGYLGSALVGLAFGAGWSPCIGPILGAVLTYSSATATVREGMVLLLVYSLGLGIPFLLAAVLVDRFLGWFQRYRRYIPWVNRVAGAILVVVGVLLVTGYFSLLATWLQTLTPDVLRSKL
ncbi:MAG TPA: cytochrome c biogenesis protein CcdA [Gemmatimonadales bacterium]|nr:cytochrome c biogenesis protein CcdA [Gemmatimonadales bacterium]